MKKFLMLREKLKRVSSMPCPSFLQSVTELRTLLLYPFIAALTALPRAHVAFGFSHFMQTKGEQMLLAIHWKVSRLHRIPALILN